MCLKNNACWLYLRNIVYSMDTASRRFYFMCYCYKIVYLLRAASCAFKAAISEIIAFFSERTAAISASFSDIRESFSDIRESFSERAASFSDITESFSDRAEGGTEETETKKRKAACVGKRVDAIGDRRCYPQAVGKEKAYRRTPGGKDTKTGKTAPQEQSRLALSQPRSGVPAD